MNRYHEQDLLWMQRALDLAHQAQEQGEVPVGAVLVKEEQCLAEGWNQTIQSHDPTAHAEIVALRKAGILEQNYRLPGSTLYVTLEPCPMCAGALVHARVERLVIGTPDPRTGCAGSLMNLVSHAQLNHQIETTVGVLGEECAQLLTQFFKQKRMMQKARKLDGNIK